MSTVLIQTTDKEFHDILKDAYVQGAKDAKKLLLQEQISDWVNQVKACELLGIKANTLKAYRYNRKIKFRGTRNNLEYCIESINEILALHTKEKII